MSEKLPRLIVCDDEGNEREVEILRTPFTLGRQDDNDLIVLDRRITRHHARIIRSEAGYAIEDLGDLSGTFVNNEKVTSVPLKSGDEIKLGPEGEVFTFRHL